MDTWMWIAGAVVVVLVVAVLVAAVTSRRRRSRLHERFGPEYDRTVQRSGGRRQAEHDLRERVERHDALELHDLSNDARAGYEQRWADLERGFVDRPQVTLADADSLVTLVMRERGYPVEDFEARSQLVSVDHPAVVENYRVGHRIYGKTVEGTASTEELRQAVIAYRSLFRELVTEGAGTG
jgi:hypothetical protein